MLTSAKMIHLQLAFATHALWHAWSVVDNAPSIWKSIIGWRGKPLTPQIIVVLVVLVVVVVVVVVVLVVVVVDVVGHGVVRGRHSRTYVSRSLSGLVPFAAVA